MPEQDTNSNKEKQYELCSDELQQQLQDALAGKSDALVQITAMLSSATPRTCEEWKPEVRRFWQSALSTIPATFACTAETAPFITALFKAGFDSSTLRDLYIALVRQTTPEHQDMPGLFEALGLRHEDVEITHIAQKWDVYLNTKTNCYCFQRSLGLGKVQVLDDATNEVKVQMALDEKRHYNVSLKNFLENAIVLELNSPVNNWLLTKKNGPAKGEISAPELETYVRKYAHAAFPLPISLARALLIPRIFSSDNTLRAFTTVIKKAESNTEKQENQWLFSRSLEELVVRLKTNNDFSLNALQQDDVAKGLQNVRQLLVAAAPREDAAFNLAMALAILQEHKANYENWMNETIADIAPKALIWENSDMFADTSDKLPGKDVPAWFEVTQIAKGSDFLIEMTMELPYKLWSHTEKVLGADADLLAQKVALMLENGRSTADMLYWVWASRAKSDKGAANLKGQLAQQFLTNSTLIFKTLLKDVKGSYLKAQRDIRKLLLSDDTFQKQVMDFGAEAAVAGLVRCAKRMTLLDASERQSLLVRIVRLYPEFISLVEDKPALQERTSVPRVTSIRSMKARQMALDYIINVEMPENRKAIEIARGFGDLRENSEFKFAKERQRALEKRRHDFEVSMNNVRATDFANVVVDKTVVPGCSVVLTKASGETTTIHLLGLLDSEPEKSIVSYETPIGRILLGANLGDTLELPDGEKATLTSISKLSAELLEYVASTPAPIEKGTVI